MFKIIPLFAMALTTSYLWYAPAGPLTGDPIVTNIPPQSLGERVQRARLRHAWSPDRLAAELGVPVTEIRQIENDRRSLSIEELQRLERVLHQPLAQL